MKSRTLLRILTLAFIAPLLAWAAAPPADTQIGNQATATYTDASNTERTATSNTVITVVQQVSSFTITTDGQGKLAAPGGQVVFPHTLTNTGNGTDTFPLAAANSPAGDSFDLTSLAIYADVNGDGIPDDSTPITTTGPLAAGATFKFVAVGIVPGGESSGATAALTVTATGSATGTPAVAQTNTDTATVGGNAVVNVTKAVDSSSGAPGSGPHTFTLTYNNTGNSTATNIQLLDVLPTGMTYVAGSARWSVTGATALTDASDGPEGTAPDTIAYDFGITVAGRVTATIARVQPGETRTLTFRVTIDGAQGSGPLNNTATYSYDPGTGTPAGPFTTNTTTFTVTQGTGVSLADATVPSATQGATVTFINALTNTGNGPDSFDITVANTSFPPGTTFTLFKPDGNTPLVDTNGNGTPDTGIVPAGGTYNVVVKATLPPGSAGVGVNYTAVVTATSKTDTTTQDTANDVLTSITANTIDITANAALPGGLGAGAGPEVASVVTNTTNPNTTTRFTIFVNNTSSGSDTFDLAASTSSTFASLTLPPGWTLTFRDTSNAVVTNTGVIFAGANKQFFVDVTVPAGETPGARDLFLRALSPTTTASDRLHAAVDVNIVRAISFTPNNTGQVSPGGAVVFSHILTNNGNVAEGDGVVSAIALAAADSQGGWGSIVHHDANNNGVIDAGDPVVTNTAFVSNGAPGLAPGESVRLLVKVIAPPGAAIGAVNATTVTATTTNGSHASAAPAVATVTDSTTVVPGEVEILKEQALDATPQDGTPDTAYTAADITAGALPGKSIRYRLTVTNRGTSAATNVRIFDTTPAFTTYTTVNPAAVTLGSVAAAPADGGTGAIEFNVGTLNPGQTAIATFGVVIDQ